MTLGDAIFSIFLICVMFCVMVISSIIGAMFGAWIKNGSETAFVVGAVMGFLFPIGVFHIK